jgi:hypothetical protein
MTAFATEIKENTEKEEALTSGLCSSSNDAAHLPSLSLSSLSSLSSVSSVCSVAEAGESRETR